MAEAKGKGEGKESFNLTQRLDFFEKQMMDSLAACLATPDRDERHKQIDVLVGMLEHARLQIEQEYAEQLQKESSGKFDIAESVSKLKAAFDRAKEDFPRAVPSDQKEAKVAASGAGKKLFSLSVAGIGNWGKKKGDEKGDAKMAEKIKEIEQLVNQAGTVLSTEKDAEEAQHKLLCALDKVLYLPTNMLSQTSTGVLSLFTKLFQSWALPEGETGAGFGYRPYDLAPRAVILAHLRLYAASLQAWEIAPQHAVLISGILESAGTAQASFQRVYTERSSSPSPSPGQQLDQAINQSYLEIWRAMQARPYAKRPTLSENRGFSGRERPSDSNFGGIFLNEPSQGEAVVAVKK